MTKDECGAWVRSLIAADRLPDFYRSYRWKKLRQRVLTKHMHECQDCKGRGRYKRADTAHHDRYIDKHPELALSEYWYQDGEQKQNLVSLCHDCHDRIHGGRRRTPRHPNRTPPERW